MTGSRSDFVGRLFETLARREIRYVVLRNWEQLPRDYPGTDIDLLVEPADRRAAERLVAEVGAAAGYEVWKRVPKNFDITQLTVVPREVPRPASVVRLDLHTSLSWTGVNFLPNAFLLGSAEAHNGVQVLPPAVGLAATLSNAILYTGSVGDKYVNVLRRCSPEDAEVVRALLRRVFGKDAGRTLEALREAAPDERVLRQARRGVLQRRFWRVPIGVLSRLRVLAGRLTAPPGDFIVLFGPDGSGKSTLAGLLCAGFADVYGRGVARFHLVPRLGVEARLSARLRERRLAVATHWELKRRRSPVVVSLLRLARLWMSFWLGYAFWIAPRLLRGQLVVGERWCFDFVYDPEAKGIHLPGWLCRMAFATCPKPRRAFALTGPFEAIAARQSDVPPLDVADQLRRIREYLIGRPGIEELDATQPLERVYDSVAGSILRA